MRRSSPGGWELDADGMRSTLGEGMWLAIDTTGSCRRVDAPPDAAAANLVVSDVGEAVKTLASDGTVEQSLDRRGLWGLEEVILNRVVVEKLDQELRSLEDLLDAIPRLGVGWVVLKRPSSG